MKTKRFLSLVLVFLMLVSSFTSSLSAMPMASNEAGEVELEENHELGEERESAETDETEETEETDETEEDSNVSAFDKTWDYFEDGVDPSSEPGSNMWAFGQYNKDANKKTGQAPFGAKRGEAYNVGGLKSETTLRHYKDDNSTTISTYFFVKKFNVEDTMSLWGKSLNFDITYDDAVIVYLNRNKIYEGNLPEGGFTSLLDYGCARQLADPIKEEVSIPEAAWRKYLSKGDNVLAVELHQGSKSSSDIYFDLENFRFEDEAEVKNEFYTPVLTIGSDESERNFTWYNKVVANGYLEVKNLSDPQDVQLIECAPHEDNKKKGYASYQAKITGLKADTEYEYTYWNGDGGEKSEAVRFKTAKEGDFSFFLVGDPQIGASRDGLGTDTDRWDKTLNILKDRMNDDTKNIAFLLSAGDQINNYTFNEEEYQSFIERSALKGMTLAPVIGNHDGEGDARSGYFEHFALPDLEDSNRADYAYVYNKTLFISLDSTRGWDAARHNEFVKKTVEKYKDKVNWKVLTFHHAIYSVASHAVDADILKRRQYIPQLVKENGIDAVLMGHDHVYVRSHIMNGTEPIVEWKDGVEGKAPSEYLNPKGALYITANSGTGTKHYNIKNQKFEYSAIQNQDYVPNYSEISVTDYTFKVVTYKLDGSVVDEVTLKKDSDEEQEEDLPDGELSQKWTYFDEGVDPARADDRYSWTKGKFNQDVVAKEASGNFGSLNGEKYYLKDEYYDYAFSADNQLKQKENKKNYPAYFFVNSFNIENLEEFKAKYPNIKLGIGYQDAVIMYLNGHKIWQANALDSYENNLSYGAGKTTGVVYKIIDNAWRKAIAPVEEDTVLTNRKFSDYLQEGKNYITFEVHSRDEESSGVYFDLYDFAFEDGIAPDKALFYTPVMTIGNDQSERNFTWYNNVLAQGYVEVKELGKDDTAKTFMAQTNENNRKNVYVNYQAKITGLKADTEYEYTYWNGENGEKSEPVRFKTAKEGDFSFFLVGDPQIGASGKKDEDAQAWDTTLNKMSERMKDDSKNFAFLLSAGDQINDYDNNEDEYKLFIERSALKGMTLAPVIGNHDGEGYARSGYFEHFALPDLNEKGRADYAYIYNNTLFISLDSTYGWDAARHNDFVKKTVEKYKDKVDWKVLTFHHAIYSVASHAVDDDILKRRQYIPQLVKDNGIDAVLMGHDHVYVRSHIMNGTEPIVEWKDGVEGKAPSEYLNPKGALYITANSGSGSKFYRIQNEKFDYSAVQNQEKVPNYSEVSVTKDTFRIVTYRVEDGTVVDDVTLRKTVEETPEPEPEEPTPTPEPEKPTPKPDDNDDDDAIVLPIDEEVVRRPRRPRPNKNVAKNEEKPKTIETKPVLPVANEVINTKPIVVNDKTFPVNFTDIVNERRADSIKSLASRGVLQGMGNNMFKPNVTVTRAMVAEVLMRISRDKSINPNTNAKDIKMSDWYYNSVKWALTHGIVRGYEDGAFRPTQKITRQELAVMLERVIKAYNIKMPNVAAVDSAQYSYLPAWSHDAVMSAVSKGLLEVSKEGQVAYNKEVNRADFAYAIDRIVEFVLNN